MLKSVGILLFCSCCFQTCSMCFPLSGGGGEVDEHSETPRESGRSTGVGMLGVSVGCLRVQRHLDELY